MSKRVEGNNRAAATDAYVEAKLKTAEDVLKDVEKRKKVLNKDIKAAFIVAAERYLKSIGIKTFVVNSTPADYAWPLYGRRAFSETRCRAKVRGMEVTFHVNLPKGTKNKFIKAMSEVTELKEKAKGWRRQGGPFMSQQRRSTLRRAFLRKPDVAARIAKMVDTLLNEERDIIREEREALQASGAYPAKRPRR